MPDFMVFLNWEEPPWFWQGFDLFWSACLMVVAVPGLLAFTFGYLAFHTRVTGVYLSIIIQALNYALVLAFFRSDMGFGGNNGLTDFNDVLGIDLRADATRAAVFAGSALALGFVICRVAVTSRLGIGRKFQKPTVFETQSVADNIMLSLAGKRSVWETLRARLQAAEESRVAEILATIRLEERRHDLAADLAMGKSNGWRSGCCWPRIPRC